METKCHKCGAQVVAGEAFCGRCGAVVGMKDAARKPEDASPNFATTVVGKKAAPAKRPSPKPAATRGDARTPPPTPSVKDGGGNARYFVLGFVAVLFALLLLLLWWNSGG